MTQCQSAFFSSLFSTAWNLVFVSKRMKEHECHLTVSCNSWRNSAPTSPKEISRGVYSSTSQAERRLGRKSLAFPEPNPRSATMPRWCLKKKWGPPCCQARWDHKRNQYCQPQCNVQKHCSDDQSALRIFDKCYSGASSFAVHPTWTEGDLRSRR